MTKFDRQTIREMKQKLDIDILGVARIDDSAPKEVSDSVGPLLPGATSAVVLGKEIYADTHRHLSL